ncbi:MAG: threonine synthase [Lachnospiraceae bacterium]|nr:threonine synthase [Lachnospiraceae bacterium]
MKEILYRSTRGGASGVKASEAILQGLAEDGGLFVPETMPVLDVKIEDLAGKSYQEIAYEVMKLFLTDYTEEDLKYCISHAYDSKFDTEEIAPIRKADGAYYLELFHGSTIAFKDMALSILPYLMTTAARMNHITDEIVILTATSGDTGKAALAGFADVPGTRIIVFFPDGGVSPIQKKQMVTQKGANCKVVAVRGNFDDCQTGVKNIFNDKAVKKEMAENGFRFSSANSINIGRLVPQIVYYVYSYATLLSRGVVKNGDPLNVVVPTGNFGNILAAYYAKLIGVPIGKLICASNENKVLFDFFQTGAYDRNREFMLTSSPSMDILISSNLERLIFRIAGDDAEKNVAMMNALSKDGRYEITDEMRVQLSDFRAGFADEAQTAEEIAALYRDADYIIDTHTAVASHVYRNYRSETGDTAPAVIASTASPYKFTRSVMTAIDKKYDAMGDFELVDALSVLSGVAVPRAIEDIRSAEVLHNTVCEIAQMEDVVKAFLGLK